MLPVAELTYVVCHFVFGFVHSKVEPCKLVLNFNGNIAGKIKGI